MTRFTRLYESLGVTPTATPDEIRAGYRNRVKDIHPDTLPADQRDAAHNAVAELSRARDLLLNPASRQLYDQFGLTDNAAYDPANVRQEAETYLMQLFGNVLVDIGDPRQRNPLVALSVVLLQNRDSIVARQRQADQQLLQLRIIRARLSHPSASNPLLSNITLRIRETEAELTQTYFTLQVNNEAQALLAEYTYLTDMEAESPRAPNPKVAGISGTVMLETPRRS
jgi:curved DNA-binding protein CbpA